MPIRNQNALRIRAQRLESNSLNGVDFVLVSLSPNLQPTNATLEVHFFNKNNINNINNLKIFTISGGHRVIAGPAIGQVQVMKISPGPDAYSLTLTVEPIGDYSTYTLTITSDLLDPLFNEIDFKFRPGCFNIDCSPEWKPANKPEIEPAIDYLAKDFDSFRHALINSMIERIPGWQPTSEADLDVVLLELFSATADELSDYQDRIMNEAYIDTAKKRVSIARHARLMDYYIYQGNQSHTYVAICIDGIDKVKLKLGKKDGFEICTEDNSNIQKFITKEEEDKDEQTLFRAVNKISLYTWDDTIPTLSAGDTTADLFFENSPDAKNILFSINDGTIQHLLLQEMLNPDTGEESGRDPNHRQILKLLRNGHGAMPITDPLNPNANIIRVFWEEKDKLQFNYCFTINCVNKIVPDVSLFNGNLIPVFHGEPIINIFVNPKQSPVDKDYFYYEEIGQGVVICRLQYSPLAYLDTSFGGSDIPPQSTIQVTVDDTNDKTWREVPDLIHSNENDRDFVVETDENGQSCIRFGNGINGKKLQDTDKVTCYYQVGRGTDGNIGADKLINFDKTKFSFIKECWNPFNVINGRDPEPVEEIIRRVPEAYRIKQLRAITLKDYIDIVEKIPGVSKASARYRWTGSWRTVQIAVDPAGKTTLDNDLKGTIATYLDAVKLIGEDYEIRPPKYIPLEIHITFCVHPNYWIEDIKKVVEQEFSDGYTSDGRTGFFHPDLWTFGQELRASQILGRVQSVKGVDYVVDIQMNRWNEVTPGTPGIIKVRQNEIIKVKNDPSQMEQGFIDFKAEGGRQ